MGLHLECREGVCAGGRWVRMGLGRHVSEVNMPGLHRKEPAVEWGNQVITSNHLSSQSAQDPKSKQLLVCAQDLTGAVSVDACPMPFALRSKSQPPPTPTSPHPHVLRALCRTGPWGAERGRGKVPPLPPISLPWHGVPPTPIPRCSPWSQLDSGGIRQRGKRMWSLCLIVVSALHKGASSPRVIPGQAGPIQPVS